MIRYFTWCTRTLAVLLVASALTGSAHAQDTKAVKAVDAWLSSYLSGKLDLSKPRINQSSPGVRYGFVTAEDARRIGHLGELRKLCAALVRLADEDAADRLLAVAAIGLDPSGKYTVEQRSVIVREIGEKALDEMPASASTKTIETLASHPAAGEGLPAAKSAAAIRALGRRKDESYRSLIEAGLIADGLAIRLAAADAAGTSELATVVPSLAAAVSNEQNDAVLIAELGALLALTRAHKESLDEDAAHAAAMAAIDSLGRGTWRSDLAAVELLAVLRSVASVPALIEVLSRQTSTDADLAELRAGVLQKRAHEVLVSLTGAAFGYERPDDWRAWWDSARDSFQLADPQPAAAPGEAGHTSTGDFFGIPVRGSRILFVIDTSGSMNAPWRGTGTRGNSGKLKIDVAKAELLKAVDRLTADCSFNLVWFNNDADVWQRNMVEATEQTKKRFQKLVEDLRADGNTNLWKGLSDGLKLGSFVPGSRYEVDYDELFILSDGIPTLGEIQHPKQILKLVRESNQYSRVTIHTVYVSGDPRIEKETERVLGISCVEFMRRLAEESGGTAVSF